MPSIIKLYESVTEMTVYERSPYSGKLVFAAFSGSHQDAISKGLKCRKDNNTNNWNVPYLPIDPSDLNREYEADVIRINSQSGKGGISYILENNFGLELPIKMREEVGYLIKDVSDKEHKELTPSEVYNIFEKNYINIETNLKLKEYHFIREGESFKVMLNVIYNNEELDLVGKGNGRLDAVSNAIKKGLGLQYTITTYSEHALTQGSTSKAVAYVCITTNDSKNHWGVGIHDDIIAASIKALFSAINK